MSSLPIGSNPASSSLRLQSDQAASEHADATNPLSDAHFEQLRLARKRVKPIEKAARYAQLSGWTTLLAGALSLPFAFGNIPMMVFSLVIAGIGTHELTLRRSLIQLDLRAPKKLALNQLILGGALMVYAVFMLVSSPSKTIVESAMEADPMMQSVPELSGMMDDLIQLEQVATAMMYVGMILMAVLVQGATALYYMLKGKKLKAMHRHTPGWVIRIYQTMNA